MFVKDEWERAEYGRYDADEDVMAEKAAAEAALMDALRARSEIERLEAELEAGSSRGRSSFGETYRAARSARQTLHNSCIVSVRKFSV